MADYTTNGSTMLQKIQLRQNQSILYGTLSTTLEKENGFPPMTHTVTKMASTRININLKTINLHTKEYSFLENNDNNDNQGSCGSYSQLNLAGGVTCQFNISDTQEG
jgi:hypothetical protein